jgi:hypothetical protein
MVAKNKKLIRKNIVCKPSYHLTSIKALPDYKIEVTFVDGSGGIVDYTQLIMSECPGVFRELRDIQAFNKVQIVRGVATWPWPNDIDVCPETMWVQLRINNGVWVVKSGGT